MLHIKSIPAFNDNYIWLIQNNQNLCAVVDPGDAEPVIAYLEANQLELVTILITHHHWDHTGGIEKLVAKYPTITVLGPENSNIEHLTHHVSEGHRINLFNEEFLVLNLPGHTLDHIGYVGDGKLFCGDVLFSAGCGRIFEARQSKCIIHYKSSPFCRRRRRCTVLTSIRLATSHLPWQSNLITSSSMNTETVLIKSELRVSLQYQPQFV